jgi:hypothetical protein
MNFQPKSMLNRCRGESAADALALNMSCATTDNITARNLNMMLPRKLKLRQFEQIRRGFANNRYGRDSAIGRHVANLNRLFALVESRKPWRELKSPVEGG